MLELFSPFPHCAVRQPCSSAKCGSSLPASRYLTLPSFFWLQHGGRVVVVVVVVVGVVILFVVVIVVVVVVVVADTRRKTTRRSLVWTRRSLGGSRQGRGRSTIALQSQREV